jgi:hypothetical protein
MSHRLSDLKFDLDQPFIDEMIARKVFRFPRILDIAVSVREEPTYIMLRLRLESSRAKVVPQRDYPISGFPRKFLVENERKGEYMAAISRSKLSEWRMLTIYEASRLQRRNEELRKRREANRAVVHDQMNENLPVKPARPSTPRPSSQGSSNASILASSSRSLKDSEYDGYDEDKVEARLKDFEDL